MFFSLSFICNNMIQIFVFCFSFRDADWDGAFNFTKDLTFLTMCAQEMKGTLHPFLTMQLQL